VRLGVGGWVEVDLQSQESYGHDPYTGKRSRSKISQFERVDGWTNGQTDGLDCITSRVNAVDWIEQGLTSHQTHYR